MSRDSVTSMSHDMTDSATAGSDRQAAGPLAYDIVDSVHTHSHGYALVGLSDGVKVWTDGVRQFKADWQGSGYDYSAMVLGFR
jgi:hypothetical protein